MLKSLRSRFGDRFADVWVLLSDTDRFVARAKLMTRFESELRNWRSRLQAARGDTDVVRDVKEEIVAFRRERRLEGWELRLGSLDIQVKGFRSDDSMAQGFSRLVLVIGPEGALYHLEGSANHVELDELLNARLHALGVHGPFEPHYLWYRRHEGVLELAGADSEPQENLEDFRAYVENHKSDLVRALGKAL